MSFEVYGFNLLSLQSAYLFSTIFLVIWLYSYIVYLYRAEKRHGVDYERYGMLALNDSLYDEVIESCKHDSNDLQAESIAMQNSNTKCEDNIKKSTI